MTETDVPAEKFGVLAAQFTAYAGYNNLRIIRALVAGKYRSGTDRCVSLDVLAEEAVLPKDQAERLLQQFVACGAVSCGASGEYQLSADAELTLSRAFFDLFDMKQQGEAPLVMITAGDIILPRDGVFVGYLDVLSSDVAVKAIYHAARCKEQTITSRQLRQLLERGYKTFSARDNKLELRGVWLRGLGIRTLLPSYLSFLAELLKAVFGLSTPEILSLLRSLYA
ncbi:MAG TPA: hypothetical protein VNG90_02460 [Candidatus Acidoferrum sp.]|nr:hypothetical protein [Candidatus Acidoferrum sp.]